MTSIDYLPPWIPQEQTTYGIGMSGLNAEIRDFLEWVKPTVNERHVRYHTYRKLQKLFRKHWPQCKLYLVGSVAYGLFLPNSDLDVTVCGNMHGVAFESVGRIIETEGKCFGEMQIISRASVPILKFVDGEWGISCDLSFNHPEGAAAADFIRKLIQQHKYFLELTFLLKMSLYQRNLTEVYEGGVGSYALIIMTVFFLQTYGTCSRDTVGDLLLAILKFYSEEFSYEDSVVSINNGGRLLDKQLFSSRIDTNTGFLSIMDPLDGYNDVSRSSYRAPEVKQHFCEVRKRLLKCLTDSEPEVPRSFLGFAGFGEVIDSVRLRESIPTIKPIAEIDADLPPINFHKDR